MRLNLFTTRQAAAKFRVNNATILRWAREVGVEPDAHGATKLFTEEQLTAIRKHRASIYTIAQAGVFLNCRYNTVQAIANENNIGTLKPPKYRVRELTEADVLLVGEKLKQMRAEEARLKMEEQARIDRALKEKPPLVSTQPAIIRAVPDVVYEKTALNGAVYLKRADAVPPNGYDVSAHWQELSTWRHVCGPVAYHPQPYAD